jgi:DNA-binding CsgD family transcriptional regulator
MNMDKDTDAPRFLVPFLVAIAVIGFVDLLLDDFDTLWSLHLLVDLSLVVLSAGTAAYLGLGWRRTSRSLRRTRRALEEQGKDRDRWHERAQELLRGLGVEIGEVFKAWGLTPAERETALLLLKGYSHKRIARLTDRSEGTARQHAGSVYRKSGLGGRAALSAFFLEQLDLPDEVSGLHPDPGRPAEQGRRPAAQQSRKRPARPQTRLGR